MVVSICVYAPRWCWWCHCICVFLLSFFVASSQKTLPLPYGLWIFAWYVPSGTMYTGSIIIQLWFFLSEKYKERFLVFSLKYFLLHCTNVACFMKIMNQIWNLSLYRSRGQGWMINSMTQFDHTVTFSL